MQNKKYFYQGLTIIISISIVVLGWVYLVYGTSIGTDIETVNLLATGTSTMATTTIGTNFYIDEAGNASTTGYFFLADASTTGTLIAGGGITGATTLTMTGESNLATLVYGGATTSLATTEPAIVQLTAAQFCDNSEMLYETIEAGVGSSTTMFMPTAAQLIADCIPAVGDTKSTFLIFSAADTASTTLTASTSINMLKSNIETDLVLDSLNGDAGDQALIICYNRNGTEVNCLFKSFIAGD